RQAFANRVLRPLRAHRHEDHLAAMSFLELQTFLDSALITGIENNFLVTREGVVSLQGERGVRIGDLFDGDDDFQVLVNYLCDANPAWNCSRSCGVFRLLKSSGPSPSSHVTSSSATMSAALNRPALIAPV